MPSALIDPSAANPLNMAGVVRLEVVLCHLVDSLQADPRVATSGNRTMDFENEMVSHGQLST